MTDDELMKKLALGDMSAFQKLFEQHSGKVYGYARRLMGDVAKAEDLSQEVWMKVIKNSNQYKPKSQFVPWIFTILRNTAFNQLRASKNKKEDFVAEERELENSAEDNEPDKKNIENFLVEQNDRELIKRKLDELPEAQRTLLVAWMTDDLTYQELSELSGKSILAVKSLLFRAKKSLEKSLKDFA